MLVLLFHKKPNGLIGVLFGHDCNRPITEKQENKSATEDTEFTENLNPTNVLQLSVLRALCAKKDGKLGDKQTHT